jgi:hypothetical protein
MWAWLLQLPPPEWPPLTQIREEAEARAAAAKEEISLLRREHATLGS